MATMNPVKKANIMKNVKSILPKGWKVTAQVVAGSELKLTIRQMPRDDYNAMAFDDQEQAYGVGKRAYAQWRQASSQEILHGLFWKDKDKETGEPLPFNAVSIFANNSQASFDKIHFFDTQKPRTQVLADIINALNAGNYDNSDCHTDYFDVGHYCSIHFGEFDKPMILF